MDKEVSQTIGDWKLQKTLGIGGFGVVFLYKNQETGEQLAVKQCKQISDLPERTCARWKQECDIMLRLEHPNVVCGRPLPSELNYLAIGDIPVLAMEFCGLGDLRKVLNRPENCCGLPEYQVRQVARDTAAGLEYLHSKHVMHRDLKPENIVMSDDGNGRISYKLIDLGYAKDLDIDSICTSFVGTMQYLAPELFGGNGSKYSSTVDYWSLGTTIFECITGVRPFLHNLPPIRWLNVASLKKHEHIFAYYNESSNKVEYSDKLPMPNQLSSVLQSYFEVWLRVMLDFDPKTRGSKPGSLAISDHKQRPYCFEHLDRILNTKLISVFNVLDGGIYASPVVTNLTASQTTIRVAADLSKVLQSVWHAAVSDQLLLTQNGSIADPSETLASYSSNQEIPANKDVINLFLFSKSCSVSLVECRKCATLSRQLQLMLENQHVDHVYDDQCEVCKHLTRHCVMTCRDIDRLLQARSVASMSLIHQRTELSTDVVKLLSGLSDVNVHIAFFNQSAETDLSELNLQQQGGIFSQKMRDDWVAIQAEVNRYSTLIDDGSKLRNRADELHLRVQQMQNSVMRNEFTEDHLETVLQVKQSRIIHENLRSLSPEQRHTAATTPDIVRCIEECRQSSLLIIAEIDTDIRQMIKCLMEIQSLRREIKVMCTDVNKAKSDIMDYQLKRQKNVWRLISQVVSKVMKEKKEPNSGAGSPPVIDLRPSSSMQTRSSWDVPENRDLHDESIGYQTKLQELVHSLSDGSNALKATLVECDWSFLDVKTV